jgi:hypothetical protein
MFSNLKSETAITLKSISDSILVKHCQIEKKNSAAHQRATQQHQHLARSAPIAEQAACKLNSDSTKNVFVQKKWTH